MGLFDKLFKRQTGSQSDTKNYLTDAEIKQRNEDFMIRFEQVKNLFATSLDIYNVENCQCAYPRFQQIIGINCSDTGNSFKCHDTDLLISMSNIYFDISNSDLTDENTNEIWTCKKCGSAYEYGWSDFSIYVERQKLKLTNLKTQLIGQPTTNPVPLCLGLAGHSYPPLSELTSVTFAEFENYMTER